MTGSQEQLKHVIDAASVGVVAGALMSWLPPIAAALTVIWTLIRILETRTVQRCIHRMRYGRKRK